ncbi:MarR family EPS-associated transcriptional regulator [Roseateles oligotrophus]|uniref:MarR family EPS-associated transcriptional regulator n=1 Tax=Roseateles oligotrophus TaxID=1769250 RepID=UPI00160E1974
MLRAITERPSLTQRQLAELLGISLGKTNFIVQAVLKRGWLKVENFKRSTNKWGYIYILTSQGISERLRLTHTFIQRKEEEYELLRREIDQLKQEISHASS